ncbi:unnamed protein product, partial [Brenthis ino]
MVSSHRAQAQAQAQWWAAPGIIYEPRKSPGNPNEVRGRREEGERGFAHATNKSLRFDWYFYWTPISMLSP